MADRPLPDKLRPAVFGPTGQAGAGVLRQRLSDPRVSEVIAITRRPLGIESPKVCELTGHDFLDFEPLGRHLTGINACFYCLGIS